jgi:hypothetical protein
MKNPSDQWMQLDADRLNAYIQAKKGAAYPSGKGVPTKKTDFTEADVNGYKFFLSTVYGCYIAEGDFLLPIREFTDGTVVQQNALLGGRSRARRRHRTRRSR